MITRNKFWFTLQYDVPGKNEKRKTKKEKKEKRKKKTKDTESLCPTII